MRNSLWSGLLEEHIEEIDSYFSQSSKDIVEVFAIERTNEKLGGFLELNVRNYAEGSRSERIPYVEGWYVDPDLRGCGYGKQLLEAAQIWSIENGFRELASDTDLENSASIAAHKALGFEEVERMVCFIKRLQ